MLNTNPLTITLLIHSLLHTPDGPAFEKAVRLLHDFLRSCGKSGELELRKEASRAIFRLLSAAVMARGEDPSLSLLHYALEQHQARQVLWLENSYALGEADINDVLFVQQEVNLMEQARDEVEIDSHFHALGERVLQKEGTLLGTCLPQIEFHLTEWMAQDLEELDLSVTERRAIALFRLLRSETCDLALAASYDGALFLLTPQQVHTVNGKEGKRFLKRELDRLANTLPLLDFLKLIFTMSNEAPEGNPVSQEVLNSYCGDLQAMFTPVR